MTDILKRIESTDHTDADACAELESYFYFLLEYWDFFKKTHTFAGCDSSKKMIVRCNKTQTERVHLTDDIPNYTTSVDACLDVLPDGWVLNMNVDSFVGVCRISNDEVWLDSEDSLTLQLALMHAIAQAIIHERENE